MSARVLRLDEVSAAEARVAFRETTADGGLVIFPTDTVYGLGARADREEPVQRIYEVKGRPAELALPLLVGSVEAARRVAQWSPAAQRLAEAFWPGPLTLVLPERRLSGLRPLVTAGRGTVGVRRPDHAALLGWLEACDFPLAVTSANRSGAPAAVRVADLPPELRETVDLILDGGACPGGVASTVVDLASPPPQILRPGPVSEQDILDALGNLS
jgi:L-threonylcarbamoyladenylate synthase